MPEAPYLEWLTWASVVVLGPGAAAIFVWFLFDLVRLLRERRR